MYERVVLAGRWVPDGRVGEHVTRADFTGRGGAGNHDDDRTNQLGGSERGAYVQTRQGLEEDHTETDTLKGVQYAEP